MSENAADKCQRFSVFVDRAIARLTGALATGIAAGVMIAGCAALLGQFVPIFQQIAIQIVDKGLTLSAGGIAIAAAAGVALAIVSHCT